jgi:threonine/homoserine/homoserine lactone efflux protein
MWVALLQGVSFATAPLLSFGPFKIFVLSQALRQGWRRSLPLALVPLLADIPVVILIWLVLQQLPDWSINGLRMTGGLFYIYLAYGLIRSTQQHVSEEVLENAPRRTFWQAITAVWITPQVYINWSIIGMPALLGYAAQSTWHMVGFIAGFYLVFVVGLALQIILAGQAGQFSTQANRYVLVAAALFLTGFGLYLFWIGATNLLSG